MKSIQHYIGADNLTAAKRIVLTIVTIAHDQLKQFPVSGRPGRIEETGELVISNTPFIITYRIAGESIDILAVHHASQRWQEAL